MELKIAGFAEDSIVDGPGIRFTVFTQGCPHGCPGCHNPQTHDFNGGCTADTDEIYKKVTSNPMLDGITLSGGEPFCQCKPLAELARKIHAFREFPLNVIAYTGYTFEYLLENSTDENGYKELLKEVDFLIDGPFILAQKSFDLHFRGSANQRYIDVQKSLKQGKAVTVSDI
ncbi:anaerobic ribonucleoside-triphosphate reductase activating protein [Ruminococcus sp. Marseille-P6503]|uniref:anaerobic ribonucleoside-triphosphate reductase activating protein n=1 Tax=Ruminococcus sp. Marseille-P6503 TaxID=2364796 RepID=UPI000F525C69|nr:anaerobic ribonucleoside-triphosphate reductase activating protein [Ruminococcus sp. Marseille-P6503]